MARQPAQITMTGKALFARLLVLEAIVVALGGAALPTDAERRKAFLAELKKDAAARAHETGHDEIKEEVDDYADEVFVAIAMAADT